MTVIKAIVGYSPEVSQFIVFRYILTTIVLIRNTFYRVQSKKSPLDAEYTSGGVFFR